jgi:hypothetical protein
MDTIELFSGTKSFSTVAKRQGCRTYTVDNNWTLSPDRGADIRELSLKDFPYKPYMLWASPPCQGFSVAVIGRNWNHDNTPKTASAELSVDLVKHTLRLIDELEPVWFFIENPRGKLRKLPYLQHLTRHTVSYCQYGDSRMKPTDIWTNAWWWTPKPTCKRGSSCHEAAPRGSKTGTQGIKGAKDRGRIPDELFDEIFYQHNRAPINQIAV